MAPRGAAEEETGTVSRPEDPADYVEWALEEVGGDGLFQLKYLFLMGLPWVYWGMQTYATLFFYEGSEIIIHCPSGATHGVCEALGEGSFPGNGTDPCSLPDGASFEFTEEALRASVLSTFGLACDREQLVPALTTVFFAGFAVGLLLGGRWADSRGRREAYLWGLVVLVAPGILQAAAADYMQFALSRGLLGFGFGAMVMTPFVWSSEFLGPEARGTVVWSSNCCFALGQILVSPLAWCLQGSWRQLAWASFLVGLPPLHVRAVLARVAKVARLQAAVLGGPRGPVQDCQW